jgi:hypothetical protein
MNKVAPKYPGIHISPEESLFVLSGDYCGSRQIRRRQVEGLRGQHLRWDVALGIQKPACKFCYPDVSGPVVPLEPLAPPL